MWYLELQNVISAGFRQSTLPAYITNHRNIIAFEKNKFTGKVYDGDLCFYRCLAYHRIKSYRVERLAKELYRKWILFVEKENLKTTEVTLSSIPDLEKMFRNKRKCIQSGWR